MELTPVDMVGPGSGAYLLECTDGDTIADCIDQCAGLDDRIDTDNNGVPDCFERIPAASTWGVIVLALLLLTAGKIAFGRSPTPAA